MGARRALIVVVAAVVGMSMVAGARPAGAQAAFDDSVVSRPLVAEAIGGLSPQLIGVEVVGSGYPAAYDAWREAAEQLELAEGQRRSGERRVGELAALEARLADELAAARVLADEAAARAADARAEMVDVAVGSFMISDSTERPHTGTDPDDEQDDQRKLLLGGAVETITIEQFDLTAKEARQAVAVAEAAAERHSGVVAEHRAATAAVADAGRRSDGWATAHEQRLAVLPTLAPSTRVAAIGLRTVVVDAYARASQHPAVGCGLPWNVLAGIGRVETRHGEHGGSAPDLRGLVSPSIIGIALDGTRQTMRITDTDGGLLDRDTAFDRAVGPMQFIPSTWSRHGVDGNADGSADPHNLYDAAASAAAYLCRSMPASGDLRQAILAYNRDTAYVDAVLGHADTYGILRLAARPEDPLN